MRFPRPHPVRSTCAVLAAGALLLLGGCAGLAGLEHPPRVTLRGIEPVQVELLEQRYLATIRVQNPNPVALPIEGLDYAISINGTHFADGVSSQRVTIPAYGEKTLQVGVTSTLLRLFHQIRDIGKSDGLITYTISGTLGLKGAMRGVEFNHDGEIDLRPAAASARARSA